METMKAVIVQNKKLRIEEIPRPEPGPYQCLLKTLFAATCNETDARFLANSAEQPKVLGHESVGRVIAVGDKVRNIREGEIWLRPTGVYSGQEHAGFGSAIGGFCEYGLVTDLAAAKEDGFELPPGVALYSKYQQKVPPTIDPKDATMMVTLKETLSWTQRNDIGPGKGVLIFGDGPVGQCFVRMAKLLGAGPIVCVGHWPHRLEKARALGADRVINRKEQPIAEACPERVADVVIDAVGKYELIAEAFPLMRHLCRYTVYGLTRTRQVGFELGTGPRQWSLVFMRMDESETHELVIEMIESGRLDPSQFYDVVLPMTQAAEAMERLAKCTADKVVLEM